MMETLNEFEKYTQQALANFASKDAAKRDLLVDAVKDLKIEKVLDLGCGAGQELLPFLEKTDAVCIGVDIDKKLGRMTKNLAVETERLSFVRSPGEKLPFADGSFDVVLCRVALPYMNNRAAIGEIARVLRPGGVFLLKTHAPLFYLGMIRDRLKTLSARQLAYPLICLAASFWHLLTARQLQKGFWQGKEIFQTRAFLEREFAKNGLEIRDQLPDGNRAAPSFMVVKLALLKMFMFAELFSNYGFVV